MLYCTNIISWQEKLQDISEIKDYENLTFYILDTDDMVLESFSGFDIIKALKSGVGIVNLSYSGEFISVDSSHLNFLADYLVTSNTNLQTDDLVIVFSIDESLGFDVRFQTLDLWYKGYSYSLYWDYNFGLLCKTILTSSNKVVAEMALCYDTMLGTMGIIEDESLVIELVFDRDKLYLPNSLVLKFTKGGILFVYEDIARYKEAIPICQGTKMSRGMFKRNLLQKGDIN